MESLQDIIGLAYTLLYLTAIGVVLSIIYGIVEWFSKDRVLKIFEGRWVFVLLGKEAYYGKMKIPPRSGGGFEILFPPEGIENPETLLAFLVENYRETGDKRFLEKAEKVLGEFKKNGLLPENYSLDNVALNPWLPPSLVSRKIYAGELGNLYGIFSFRYTLSRKELEKRWKEVRRLYSLSLLKRIKRKIYNGLAYVKDKIGSAISGTTTPLLTQLTPELRKSVTDIQTKMISTIGSTYDSLLEDSIGRLITIQIVDVDGETKFYQGILREYSGKYILLYDVDYRLQMKMAFKGARPLNGYPQSILSIYGYKYAEAAHLGVQGLSWDGGNAAFKLVNLTDEYLKLEKVRVDGNELTLIKILPPKGEVEVKSPAASGEPTIEVDYEICREADIIWPRAKVKVIGLGDYPPDILGEVLSSTRVFK